jgi:L-alanine-DL-glutamate epimerase-like enolase superfamily enzyme
MSQPLIHSITLKPVSFPFKTAFVTAAGHKQQTDNVQITLQLSNGTQGKAEASSSIALASESQENMRRILAEMTPELRGKSIVDYKALIATIWRISRYHPTAAAAMECALMDAVARTRKQPLAALLGGKNVPLETDLTLSVGDPDVMADSANLK